MNHVGERYFQEQTTHDDRLSGFSKTIFFKYKTCANCVSSHRPLNLANTKHDMKADGNTLQHPVEFQSMYAYLPQCELTQRTRKDGFADPHYLLRLQVRLFPRLSIRSEQRIAET